MSRSQLAIVSCPSCGRTRWADEESCYWCGGPRKYGQQRQDLAETLAPRTHAAPCPCGCPVTGSKLTRYGHVKNCSCRSCLGRRNRRKGQAGQAHMHRAAGGQGVTPTNEESGRGYRVMLWPEAKRGRQIPASFVKFTSLDWTRRAFSQAIRSLPAGLSATEPVYPAIWLELPGRQEADYFVVMVPRKGRCVNL